MDITLSFLAKSVDKRGITQVHITYPPLDNETALNVKLVFDRLLQVILTELRKQVNSGQRSHVSLTSFRPAQNFVAHTKPIKIFVFPGINRR